MTAIIKLLLVSLVLLLCFACQNEDTELTPTTESTGFEGGISIMMDSITGKTREVFVGLKKDKEVTHSEKANFNQSLIDNLNIALKDRALQSDDPETRATYSRLSEVIIDAFAVANGLQPNRYSIDFDEETSENIPPEIDPVVDESGEKVISEIGSKLFQYLQIINQVNNLKVFPKADDQAMDGFMLAKYQKHYTELNELCDLVVNRITEESVKYFIGVGFDAEINFLVSQVEELTNFQSDILNAYVY